MVGSTFWNRLRLAGITLLLFGALGYLVSLLLFIPRPVPLVALAVTAYDRPYAPNGMALENVRRLAETFGDYENIRSRVFDDVERPLDVPSTLAQQLKTIIPGGPGRWWFGRKTIVLYISAHGVVDAAGEPALVVNEPSSERPMMWPVRQLLQSVDSLVTGPRVQRLVILDAGLIDQQWEEGLVANRFATRVDQLVQELAFPRLAVLQANGFGEPATVSPELGGTAFGYFLAAGLRGAADLAGNNDHRISLRELERYLQTSIGQWSSQTRGRWQQPIVSPGGVDFELAAADNYVAPAPKPWQLPANIGELDAAWERFRQLDGDAVLTAAPLVWADLQQLLSRWEQLVWSGQAYGAQRQEVRDRVLSLLDQLESIVRPASPLNYGTVSQIERWNRLQPAWNPQSRFMASVAGDRSADGQLSKLTQRWSTLADGKVQVELPQLTELQQEFLTASQAAGWQLKETQLLGMMIGSRAAVLNPALNQPLLGLWSRSAAAGATLDDRAALDWLNTWNQRLDQSRNALTDEYFTATPAVAAGLPELARQYGDLSAAGEQLSAAYAQRDRMLAEGPYWLRWCLNESRWRGDENPLRIWQQLVPTLARLDEELSHPVQAGTLGEVNQRLGREGANLVSGAPDCVEIYTQLLDLFLQRHQELVNLVSEEVTQHRAEILQLLELPLPHIERSTLRSRVMADERIVQPLLAQLSGPDLQKIDGQVPSTPAGIPKYADWLARLETHPAEGLLRLAASEVTEDAAVSAGAGSAGAGSDGAANRPAERAADSATQFDDRMSRWERDGRGLVERVRRLATQLARSVPGDGTPSPQELRQRLRAADRQARRLAFVVQPWPEAVDPCQARWVADRHARLLESATRELRDFWGPDYFQRAARHQLDLAADQAVQSPQLARLLTDESVAITNELDRLVQASQKWQPVTGVSPVISDDLPQAMADVRFQLEANDQVASGLATVFLVDGQPADRDRSPRQTTATQKPPAELALRLTSAAGDAPKGVGSLAIEYYFRGHERLTPIVTEPGLTVQALPVPESARVVVEDAFFGRLVVVLDCSGSMVTDQRFKAARQSLYNLLDTLQKLPRCEGEVAIFAYGHRTNWRKDTPADFKSWTQALYDPDATGVHPSADVELIVPMAPLNAQHARRIRERVDQLSSRGLTPLYLSIKEALTAMAPVGDGELHILVLTDGNNQQGLAIPKDTAEQELARITTADEVRATPGFRQARVDICLFGVTNPQDAQYGPLKQIAQDSRRGEFVTAGNEQELSRRLVGLALGEFRVVSAGAGQQDFISTGLPQILEKVEPNTEYQVEYDGVFDRLTASGIRLEGGEAVEVDFSPAEHQLQFKGFRESMQTLPESHREISSAGQRWNVRVHDPEEQTNGTVSFRVSLQNLDATEFTRRPTAIWAELRPIVGQRPHVYDSPPPADTPTYYFMDRSFEPGRPVPVLQLDALRWPTEARFADVRIWLTFQDSNSLRMATKPLNIAAPREIELSKDVRLAYTVDPVDKVPWTISITESHQPDSTLFPLVVLGPAGSERTTHTFLNDARQARHVWRFPTIPPALSGQAEVPIRVGSHSNLAEWIETGPLLIQLRR